METSCQPSNNDVKLIRQVLVCSEHTCSTAGGQGTVGFTFLVHYYDCVSVISFVSLHCGLDHCTEIKKQFIEDFDGGNLLQNYLSSLLKLVILIYAVCSEFSFCFIFTLFACEQKLLISVANASLQQMLADGHCSRVIIIPSELQLDKNDFFSSYYLFCVLDFYLIQQSTYIDLIMSEKLSLKVQGVDVGGFLLHNLHK